MRAFAIALLVVGCRGTTSRLCDAYCDCEPCTEERYDDCVHGIQNVEDQAGASCGEQAEDWLTCMADNATCNAGMLATEGCDSSYETLGSCLGVTPCCPTIDPCGRASSKLVDCGLVDDVTSSSYCTDIIRCVSECINAAPCSEIAAGIQASSSFTSCFAACG